MIYRDWNYWWSLPGPSGFVRSIVDAIRQGTNVIIGLPRWAPEGLGEAVDAELSGNELLSFRRLSLNSCSGNDPMRLLVRYAHDLPERDLHDEATLAGSRGFWGHVVWITEFSTQNWEDWRYFIERYADAVRSQPEYERGVLCLVVEGMAPEMFPKGDVALSIHLWKNAIMELDMLAWLHHLMGQQPQQGGTQRRLKLRHALMLVGYDPQLAFEAVDHNLELLTSPSAWLASIASARDWTNDTEICWEKGTCDLIEGLRTVHPAILSIKDTAQADIARLVWRAQIGVLFPLIEEERIRFLKEYSAMLRVPHDTGHGSVIKKKEDLEIGHIHYQLRSRVDTNEEKRLRLLRDIRNALAHCVPVNPQKLQNLLDSI
jgi:hypothetical protein